MEEIRIPEWVYLVPLEIPLNKKGRPSGKKPPVFLMIFGDSDRIDPKSSLSIIWDWKKKTFDCFIPEGHLKIVRQSLATRVDPEKSLDNLVNGIKEHRQNFPEDKEKEAALVAHYLLSVVQTEARRAANEKIKNTPPKKRPIVNQSTIFDVEMAIVEGQAFWSEKGKIEATPDPALKEKYKDFPILRHVYGEKKHILLQCLWQFDPRPCLFFMSLINDNTFLVKTRIGFDVASVIRTFLRKINLHPNRVSGAKKRFRMGDDDFSEMVKELIRRYPNQPPTPNQLIALLKDNEWKASRVYLARFERALIEHYGHQ